MSSRFFRFRLFRVMLSRSLADIDRLFGRFLLFRVMISRSRTDIDRLFGRFMLFRFLLFNGVLLGL